MKRVLALLSLVCVLAFASACHYETNISADASAELTYANGKVLRIDPVT